MQSFEAELRQEPNRLHLLFCEQRLVATNSGKGGLNRLSKPGGMQFNQRVRLTARQMMQEKGKPAAPNSATGNELFWGSRKTSGMRGSHPIRWNATIGVPKISRNFITGKMLYPDIISRRALSVSRGEAGTSHSAAICGHPSIDVELFGDRTIDTTLSNEAGLVHFMRKENGASGVVELVEDGSSTDGFPRMSPTRRPQGAIKYETTAEQRSALQADPGI